MEETLKWEHAENRLAEPPVKVKPYLVKGFVIEKGQRRRVIRLAWFDGSSFEECGDMIIEAYAGIRW